MCEYCSFLLGAKPQRQEESEMGPEDTDAESAKRLDAIEYTQRNIDYVQKIRRMIQDTIFSMRNDTRKSIQLRTLTIERICLDEHTNRYMAQEYPIDLHT